jgi:hypothetical protein
MFSGPARAADSTSDEATEMVKSFELTSEADVTDAAAIGAQITRMAAMTMECIKGGSTPQMCQCDFPDETTTLKNLYKTTLEKHPEWADAVVNYSQENITTSVSFPDLAEQFTRCEHSALKSEQGHTVNETEAAAPQE